MPSPDIKSSTDEIVLDESANENLTPNVNPISAEDETRELAKVIRRMHAANKRYREESKFLLLRNEVALHTLFQDNKSTIPQHKVDNHFQVEEDGEGREGERPCFHESKLDEEVHRIGIVDTKVDHKPLDEKWRGAMDGLREPNPMTPQSLDVQIIEDRIDKARLDLSFLEQQTMQMEIEMKALQMELAKLKDQLCQN